MTTGPSSDTQHIQKLTREIQELSALFEISKAMTAAMDLEKKLQMVLDVLHSKLAMERATLALIRPQTQEIVIHEGHRMSKEEVSRGRYKIGEGITGKVVETGEPIAIRNINDEPLFLNRTGTRDLKRQNISFICVPIKTEKGTIGALSVDRLLDDRRTLDDDIHLLEQVADTIADAARVAQSIEAQRLQLANENERLRSELKKVYRPENIIGESKPMVNVYSSIQLVAPTKATVMLRGESGTGKELVAHAIHYNSPRADKPFVRVSCASLPETLLESELFGHEKGAFTGALARKIGRFELAHGGTIFLDEIGDISMATQVKLLRVIQERSFERVGGTETLHVDIRFITATNKDLEAEVKARRFREDLYYRLNVIPIFLPSLRERREDIPMLAEHFLKKTCREHGKSIGGLSQSVWDHLINFSWPGNVRELENMMERAVVLCEGNEMRVEHFPTYLQRQLTTDSGAEMGHDQKEKAEEDLENLTDAVNRLEERMIKRALVKTGGNKRKAAKLLGVTERILSYKMRRERST